MLSLVVVCGLSGLASTAALAGPVWAVCIPYATGKWKNALCTEAAPPNAYEEFTVGPAANETRSIAGTSGESTLVGELTSKKITIICLEDVFSGTLESNGKSSGTVTFEKCKLYEGTGSEKKEISNCGIANINFKFLDQLVGTTTVEDEFKPASGTLFVEIEITGSLCALKGKQKVEGTQNCKLPEAETQLLEHTIECTPAGSHLTFAGKPAEFTSTEHVHTQPPPRLGLKIRRQ